MQFLSLFCNFRLYYGLLNYNKKLREYFRFSSLFFLSLSRYLSIPTLEPSWKNFNGFIFSLTIFPFLVNKDEIMNNPLIFIIFSLLLFEFVSILSTRSSTIGGRGNEKIKRAVIESFQIIGHCEFLQFWSRRWKTLLYRTFSCTRLFCYEIDFAIAGLYIEFLKPGLMQGAFSKNIHHNQDTMVSRIEISGTSDSLAGPFLRWGKFNWWIQNFEYFVRLGKKDTISRFLCLSSSKTCR